MMHAVVATRDDAALFVLRLTLGLVIFPHGAQKLLGWYGGYGLKGTMGFFTQTLKIPALFGALAIAAEFLGSLGLIVGLLGRVAALGIFCVMLVAAWMVHRPNGFFMNWYGSQNGEGFEYHLQAAGAALAVIIGGSGAWSLDLLLLARL